MKRILNFIKRLFCSDVKDTDATIDSSIEIIDSVIKHPNADRLDLVTILGYVYVAQRGLYKGGEKIVYIRPDAVLPDVPWTAEYRKYSPKRIKAVKLRGEFSEGIIVPFDILPEEQANTLSKMNVGDCTDELLEITHYNAPEPQQLDAFRSLPYYIPKTNEKRFEEKRNVNEVVGDILLKEDGQSCSFYYHIGDDKFGVLGRTFELKTYCKNKYTDHVERYDIENKLKQYCIKHNVSLCIRGESYGKGIQANENNPAAKLDNGWAMFSVYNIDTKEYERKGSKHYFLNITDEIDLPHVKVIESYVMINEDKVKHYSTGITKIDGKPFEGVVVQTQNGSFKVINKDYDSKK